MSAATLCGCSAADWAQTALELLADGHVEQAEAAERIARDFAAAARREERSIARAQERRRVRAWLRHADVPADARGAI